MGCIAVPAYEGSLAQAKKGCPRMGQCVGRGMRDSSVMGACRLHLQAILRMLPFVHDCMNCMRVC
eukprot:1155935-Pelagomonas_calceolata.AAC.6